MELPMMPYRHKVICLSVLVMDHVWSSKSVLLGNVWVSFQQAEQFIDAEAAMMSKH